MALPSKKIIPLLTACLVAGGTVAFAATYKTPIPQAPAHIVLENTDPSLNTAGDEWKNTLAAVEPGASSVKVTATTTPDKPLTTTAVMARDLLTSYISLKQQGKDATIDPDSLIQSIAVEGAYIPPATTTKLYDDSDIHMTSDDSDAAVKALGNATAAAILNNTPNVKETELSIMLDAANDQDKTRIKDLNPIIASYQKTAAALLKVPTPPSAVPFQVNLANDFSSLANIDTRLGNFFTDPADSLYALKDYEDASMSLVDDLRAFGMYLSSRNINYGSQEAGTEFYKTI